MKLKWSSITLSDFLLLGGFAALCYGCSLWHPGAAWVTGGGLVMWYARQRALGLRLLELKKRDS